MFLNLINFKSGIIKVVFLTVNMKCFEISKVLLNLHFQYLNHKHEMFLNTYLENPHISEEFINCKHIIFLYFYYFSYL